MPDLTAKRTLVKSPPELWAELSEVDRLAVHLEAFGEIRITKLEPEHRVAWEGEHASGTVSIAPSGWGTKVTLTAELEAEPEPRAVAPAAPGPEAMDEEPVAAGDERTGADVVEEREAEGAEPAVTRDEEPETVKGSPEAAVERESEVAGELEPEAAVEQALEAAVERELETVGQDAPGAVVADPEPEGPEKPGPAIAETPDGAQPEAVVATSPPDPPKRGFWARLFGRNAVRGQFGGWAQPQQVGNARSADADSPETSAVSDSLPAEPEPSPRAASELPSFSAPTTSSRGPIASQPSSVAEPGTGSILTPEPSSLSRSDPTSPYPGAIAASTPTGVAHPTPRSAPEPDLDGRAADPVTAAPRPDPVGPGSMTARPGAGIAASRSETASSQGETAASQGETAAAEHSTAPSQPFTPEAQSTPADPETGTAFPGPKAAPERPYLDAARAQAALDQVLDVLGAAHHRPFSRG
ncbi:MAG TPA: hypothetical protein VEY90_05885 [Thermoleophilaceae bacterium]|nr:hypothetical protein [Thermoleophilaceae bacterium]